MSAWTKKEVCALAEFRKCVEDVLPKDEFSQRDDYLIRWLRAREMNLDKAEEMLRHSLIWRKKNDMDKNTEINFDPELTERFPFHIDGLDKLGGPVMTAEYGKWDVKGFIDADPQGMEKFVKYFSQIFELTLGEIKRLTLEKMENGQNAKRDDECLQFTIIFDLAGFSFRQLVNIKAVQACLNSVSVYEAHYPETVVCFLAINSKIIF